MADKVLKTRIALRRDSESNYSSSFVPLKGELCIIDTPSHLIRTKVGDGVTAFSSLPYEDEKNAIIYRGYYLNSKFYVDSTYQTELDKSDIKIYLDKNTNLIYSYDTTTSKFVCVNDTIPKATDSVAGVMKLYQNSGVNTDGAMSQKTVTEGVQSIKFAVDTGDTECLVLDLPWD